MPAAILARVGSYPTVRPYRVGSTYSSLASRPEIQNVAVMEVSVQGELLLWIT